MARVLLIEPDHILATTYQQALRQAGHDVAAAATAQTAILAADQHRPEIIVLELQLVEHSGIEFLYELRSYQDWQAIPVIIQTQVPPGEFQTSRQLLTEQFGVHAYLYKPHSTLQDLLAAIQRVQAPIAT